MVALPLRVARPSPHRAHHRVAQTKGLELIPSLAWGIRARAFRSHSRISRLYLGSFGNFFARRCVCFAFRNNSNIQRTPKKESTWRDPQELTQFLKLQWAISYAVFCLKKKRRPLKTLSASPKAPRNSRTPSAERRKSGPITTA